ncbi:MAG: homoserine kinase [Candidatus Izemoplasma sp.]
MFRIKVPATSANLGPGFDTVAVAFNLFNVFEFSKDKNYSVIGFEDRFNIDHNLVLDSYKKTIILSGKKLSEYRVKISLIKQNIPTSRGLGSSASCVVAGVFAANYLLDNYFSINECIKIATDIEGHIDNVAAAVLGGLTTSYKVEDNYISTTYNVSDNLKFAVTFPNIELSTTMSRKVIPMSLSYSDIIFNLSRAIQLIPAFESGDMTLLKDILNDKLHEPYRLPLIDNAETVYQLASNNKLARCLSGSGPSILLISNNELNINNITTSLVNLKWTILNLKVCNYKVTIEKI